jgi:hypothetical protein
VDLTNEFYLRHEAIAILAGHSITSFKMCDCVTGCMWCHKGAVELPQRYVINRGLVWHVFAEKSKQQIEDTMQSLLWRSVRSGREADEGGDDEWA